MKNQLQVGNLVGIHLKKQSSLSSSSSSSTTSNITTGGGGGGGVGGGGGGGAQANHKQSEWKVGNSIRVLHNLNLIPLHTLGMETLLHQIESNHPSLRELILDGIIITPPSSIISTTTTSPQQQQQQQQVTPLFSTSQHLEVLIEAIGQNTTIKKCSLRYSHINDEIASMLALALVDNTTMTSLSLKGNNLTSVAVQNFYSVLKSENDTLRVLDISENDMVEEEVGSALDQFMEQRALKRMLTMKAERAKRMARGMPLLNEMLDGEDYESVDDDWRIGSGVVGGGRRKNPSGSVGNHHCDGCGLTVVCHPGIMDGTFHLNETTAQLRRSNSGNSFGSYPQSVGAGSSKAEEDRRYAESVDSDITGIGNEPHAAGGWFSSSGATDGSPPPPLQPMQYPYQPAGNPQQRSNRLLDPNYDMDESTSDEGNDSSTNNTGNESLDQRQRQQLATVSPNRNSVRFSTSSQSQYSTGGGSRTSLNLSNQDYINDKADERELRRQLATQGQAIGAYAIDVEAPDRQEIRGRRARVSRTESQRRARLAELSGNSGGGGGGGVATTLNNTAEGGRGGDLVDANIERMEEYEYRNLSMYQKASYKIGLGGEEKKTERMICWIFCFCVVVLVIAISLYLARDSSAED